MINHKKSYYSALLVRYLGVPIAVAVNVFMARCLGPEKYGRYLEMTSLAFVAGALATFGADSVLVREISARGKCASQTIYARISWAKRHVAFFALFAYALTIIWLVIFKREDGLTFGNLAEIAIIIGAVSVLNVQCAVLAGMSKVTQSQAIQNVIKNIALGTGFLLLWLLGFTTVFYTIATQILSLLVASVVASIWIKQEFASQNIDIKKSLNYADVQTKTASKILFKSASRFFGMTAAVLILVRMDIIIVAAASSAHAAGIFGVAARLAQFAAIQGLILFAWIQPRISRLFARKEYTNIQNLVSRSIIGSVAITGLSVLFAFVFARQIVLLLGSSFIESENVFRILLLGYLMWSVAVPYAALLSMTHGEATASKIYWLQVLVTLPLCFVLASEYGAQGAAVAWTLGLTIASGLMILAGVRKQRDWRILQSGTPSRNFESA